MKSFARLLLVAALCLGLGGCAFLRATNAPFGRNYLDPLGPRVSRPCEASTDECRAKEPSDGSILLVSFNIHFGNKPTAVLETLRRLERPDVLLLQEADCQSAQYVARQLAYAFVYYPAAVHPLSQRTFGVALLTSWNVLGDRKILIPHLSRSDGARKVAMAVVIESGGTRIKVVNVHLQSGLTPVDIGDEAQVVARCALHDSCLEDPRPPALAEADAIVVAGDFNTNAGDHLRVLDQIMAEEGLRRIQGVSETYATPYLRTFFDLDHVYATPAIIGGPGRLGKSRKGSDHYPVMVTLRRPGRPKLVAPAGTSKVLDSSACPELS